MEGIKKSLIEEAQRQYTVLKHAHDGYEEQCFTREGDMLIYWFLTEDGSTHILIGTADTLES